MENLSHPKQRWWKQRPTRLSVRMLMILVLLVGGGLGWFSRRATVQRDAVKAIEMAGGSVYYDFQQFNANGTPPGPKWLVDLLGVDFFADVTCVTLLKPQTDAILAHVGRLRLRNLTISMTKVTDTTFTRLSSLRSLEELALLGEKGSDAGMTDLRSLSNLRVVQLSGPWVTDAGLAQVSKMDTLWAFFVFDVTSVSARGLHDLHRLSPALRIDVNGTGRVSQAHLDELRNAVETP